MKKIAIVGLDTSHSTALPGLMQDPETPPENLVTALHATRCLRFETPFQGKEGLDKRQAYLEGIGVQVTENIDEAVADCDAILMEINDPAYHLEYFKKCAALGKPIFLDKPFADTLDNTRKIIDIAKANNVRFFTSSSLRFDVDFQEMQAKKREMQAQDQPVLSGHAWGPVGKAPAGSSLIWYGVHAFEILQSLMGLGAVTINGFEDEKGYVFHVVYADGRRGVLELHRESWSYGAVVRSKQQDLFCHVTGRIPFYRMLLEQIVRFLDGEQPVSLADSFEVMAMLQAADDCITTGKPQNIQTL